MPLKIYYKGEALEKTYIPDLSLPSDAGIAKTRCEWSRMSLAPISIPRKANFAFENAPEAFRASTQGWPVFVSRGTRAFVTEARAQPPGRGLPRTPAARGEATGFSRAVGGERDNRALRDACDSGSWLKTDEMPQLPLQVATSTHIVVFVTGKKVDMATCARSGNLWYNVRVGREAESARRRKRA